MEAGVICILLAHLGAFNVLASLCSGPGWFESHFVGNPEARFSRVMAHMYMCVGCGCSLLLDICIFLMFEGPKED